MSFENLLFNVENIYFVPISSTTDAGHRELSFTGVSLVSKVKVLLLWVFCIYVNKENAMGALSSSVHTPGTPPPVRVSTFFGEALSKIHV